MTNCDHEGKIKTFQMKENEEAVTSTALLQATLKEGLQVEGKWHQMELDTK